MKKLLMFLVALFLAGCASSSTPSAPSIKNTSVDTDFNTRALAILKPKCDSGNFSACNDLALSYQNLQDHKTAFNIYERTCKSGYQKACTNLANMYMYGDQIGLKKDTQKALEIYKNSCVNQGADSCYYLGEYYRSDDGKESDFAMAFDAYSRGCTLGDMPSCTNMGILYELGLGTQKDEYKALQIYKSSCFSGEVSGCDNMKRIQGR